MIAGIDIGSCTTKLVVLERGELAECRLVPTGVDPLAAARSLLGGRHFEVIAATGYGRHLAKAGFANKVLTEIKACALGAYHLAPELRMVIDIGGQDCKVIALDGQGGFEGFAMNDRCAAGTGRFLEVMARTLGFGLEEFGSISLEAKNPVKINSMCTVFAESEVTSLIARGEDIHRIALGVHQSVVDRVSALARNLGVKGEVLLAGGVANNPCIAKLLESRLGVSVTVPKEAQFVAALGAALSVQE